MTKTSIQIIAIFSILLTASVAQAKEWTHFSRKDEMTGKSENYAHSPHSSPTRKMSFPYGRVQGWLGFGCDAQNEWVYIGFTESPNLTNTETKSGYNLIETRIRWDDEVSDTKLTQDWGDRFLRFYSDAPVIRKMMGANKVLLELNWYGSGRVYFKFSLRGSSKAIAAARAGCR